MRYYIVHKNTGKVMDIFSYPINGKTYVSGTWGIAASFYGKMYQGHYADYWVTSNKSRI